MLCMSPLLLLLLPTSPAVGTLRTSSSSSSVNEVCDWDVCLDAVAGASKRKKDENPNCVRFDINNFDRNSRSIFYGEARGRLGNQLLGYVRTVHNVSTSHCSTLFNLIYVVLCFSFLFQLCPPAALSQCDWSRRLHQQGRQGLLGKSLHSR